MSKTLLELNNVTAAYGKKIVLHNATLSLAQNEFVVICGPNGGGKTTLLKLLAGLLEPKEGHIQRHNNLITGYLPQYRGIDREFPITVEETVLSGLNCRKNSWQSFTSEHKVKVNKLLEAFQLADLARRPINSLSGGQWQRTLIARSLAGNPDLWLLDEPDTHLDAENLTYLHQKIAEEAGHRTIVIVTHNPESLSAIPGKRIFHVENHQIEEIKSL